VIWRLLFCFFFYFPLLAVAQDEFQYPPTPAMATIGEIRFVGNKTTRPEILLQVMLLKVGQPANPRLIERSRQAIMDLGLFKSVTAVLLDEAGRTVLLITVKEKYYILPVPKLNRDADNNFTLGAQLRMDNLAGLNQRLRVTYEAEKVDNSAGTTKTTRLEYTYPRIRGTPYDIDFNVGRTRIPSDTIVDGAPEAYQAEVSNASLGVNRWLRQETPTVGWRAGSGLTWQKQVYDVYAGTPPNLREGRAVAIIALLEHTKVHDYLYSRGGRVYGYNGTFGVPSFGSDSDFTLHQFYFRGYYPMSDKPHRTVDVQVQLGLARDTVFGPAYALGGSGSLRGYASNSITGNAFFLVNVEYLTPFYNYYPLRAGAFMDVGNTYPSNAALNFSDLKTSVGLSLRLKLKSFVKIDLRVDYAYAVETGDTKVYAGTKEQF
jgi:outer membrane protein assembly factor BamA